MTKNAVFVANLVLSLCLCMPIYMNQKWYISNKNDVLYHILRGQAWNLLKRHPIGGAQAGQPQQPGQAQQGGIPPQNQK